jgi:hypothetical protein
MYFRSKPLALIIHESAAQSALPACHLIWHIYCTITWRIKIDGAEHSRKSPVTFNPDVS